MYVGLVHVLMYTRAQTYCVSMQASGLDEQYNQTLANSRAMFAKECRSSWDESCLKYTTRNIRSQVN